MAWTTPRTWVAGELVTAAMMNAHVRDNLNALHQMGTWVPIIGGAGGQTGQTYATQNGTYIRVGDLVVAHANVALSVKGTITGSAYIRGLPFTCASGAASAEGIVIVGFFASLAANFTWIGGHVIDATTDAILYGLKAAAASVAAVDQADIGNASQFVVTAAYRAVAA